MSSYPHARPINLCTISTDTSCSTSLGYNDLGFTNGNITHTPNANAAVAAGIRLTHYHTYKVRPPNSCVQSLL